MLDRNNTALVLVDIQGNLAGLMHDKHNLYCNVQKLIRSLKVLNIPIIWLEQNPEGIGPTVPVIANLLEGQSPISKMTFSAYTNKEFKQALTASKCKQILVAGIESHVCVYQTVMDLHQAGFEVEVISDAVSSRTQSNKQLALLKMQSQGVQLTSTEMALFELLGTSEGQDFKEIIKIIK
ncbi:hydrolase [Thalassomonas sp. M1454]|uniref:hydrolase n=1 Tax=Thalassomonas sp. M1454 TaxID=2594477 RepID=UPI0011804A26|nr:hydrolase [Thalassomonas sp. M1454]TRX57115.1 hydrolase [Thalassomonas sp. M1454]